MEVKDYIEHLKQFDKAYINEQLLRIVQNNSPYILDLNESQLLSGIDGDGNAIKSYTDSKYATFKNNINPVPGLGTPDLKLTGSFYENRYLQFNGEKGWPVEIFSRDVKTPQLLSNYGKQVLQLTEDNLENLREHIEPEVEEMFSKIFLLR